MKAQVKFHWCIRNSGEVIDKIKAERIPCDQFVIMIK